MTTKVNFIGDSTPERVVLHLLVNEAEKQGRGWDFTVIFNIPDPACREVDVKLTINDVEVSFTEYLERIFAQFDKYVEEEAKKKVDAFFSRKGLTSLTEKIDEISDELSELKFRIMKERTE